MVAGGGLVSGGVDDVDDVNQPFTRLVFRVAMLAAVGGFLFGYDTGIVSGAMIFMEKDLELNDEWQELVVSITIFGAWIFSMVAGPLARIYGRKKVVYFASIIFTTGSFVMAAAWDKWIMLVGRFVVGAAIGLASMIVPMFIAEMAPVRLRGPLVTTNNLFIAGGQAFAAIIAGLFGFIHGSAGWRLMLGFAAVPAILQFIGFFFVPESPRWLMQVGREQEARESLQALRGPDSIIDKEFQGIIDTCTGVSKTGQGEEYPTATFAIIKKVLGDRHLRKALLVGCMLQTVQQLTGINTVMYYSATIIKMSGVHDDNDAVWMAALTAVLNFLVNFIGIYLVERIGRRWLLLGSLGGVVVSLAILAVGFQILENTSPDLQPYYNKTLVNSSDTKCYGYSTCTQCVADDSCVYCYDEKESKVNHCLQIVGKKGYGSTSSVNYTECSASLKEGKKPSRVVAENWCPSPYSWLTLFGLCVYLFFFGPGLGPMPWTINSELFPLWCRSTCYSITTAFNWLFNMLVSLTFLTLTKVLSKPGAFWLYAGFGAAGFIFFVFFLPETKGRSLESDIGTLLDKQEEDAKRRASDAKRRASDVFRSAQRRLSDAVSRRRSSNVGDQ